MRRLIQLLFSYDKEFKEGNDVESNVGNTLNSFESI
jgi:hypothetical protein